jgi:hypothetical protein
MNNRIRILLDDQSTEHLQQMIKELKKVKGVSLSPSDLGSWIIVYFNSSQFEKQKPEIVKSFTNFKKLVRDNLKTAMTQEELILSLKSSLESSVSNKKNQQRNKNKTEMKLTTEEIKEK